VFSNVNSDVTTWFDDVYMFLLWLFCTREVARPSFARLPTVEDRSGAVTRLGVSSVTHESDVDTLSNCDEARRATNNCTTSPAQLTVVALLM